MKPYQITEHTADIGLQIWGRDFKELLIHGAEGLFDLVTDLGKMKRLLRALPVPAWPAGRRQAGEKNSGSAKVSVNLEAENAAELFLRWLREWVFLFSTKRVIPVRYHFSKLTQRQLAALIDCVIFDPRVHEQKYEIKAVTYHAFKISSSVKGWSAEVIFDV